MFPDSKPYSSYRTSGVEWLGEVPTHWEVRRIKTLFREKDERSNDRYGELLSLTRSHGLIPQAKASNRIASIEDLSNYKVCRPGDLVMNRMQAWSGMFAVPSQEGLISPDYSVFELVGESEVKYFEHLFKTSLLVEQFAQKSKGIGSGFNRLYTADFGSIPTIVPPLPEQTAIVRFLDHADRRIRRYIRAKQKLIALLEEQKQAIIDQTVTGQINVRTGQPYPTYKPSGVEWLTQVPVHWNLLRGKFLFRCIDVRSSTGEEELLTVSSERGVVPRSSATVTMFQAESYVGYKLCWPGDLVINSLWAWGRGLGVSRYHGIVSSAYGVYRLRPAYSKYSHYIHRLVRSTPFNFELHVRSKGIWKSRLQLTDEAFLDALLPVPPTEDQVAIVACLDKISAAIDPSIRRTYRQIEVLHEYRTRLIADVVTGKLDVREAAAELPEVDPLAEDDLDSTIHDRENLNLGELDAEESAAEFTIKRR